MMRHLVSVQGSPSTLSCLSLTPSPPPPFMSVSPPCLSVTHVFPSRHPSLFHVSPFPLSNSCLQSRSLFFMVLHSSPYPSVLHPPVFSIPQCSPSPLSLIQVSPSSRYLLPVSASTVCSVISSSLHLFPLLLSPRLALSIGGCVGLSWVCDGSGGGGLRTATEGETCQQICLQ
jgi:hypothetical protein